MQTRNSHTHLLHKILNKMAFAFHNLDVPICFIHITNIACVTNKYVYQDINIHIYSCAIIVSRSNEEVNSQMEIFLSASGAMKIVRIVRSARN